MKNAQTNGNKDEAKRRWKRPKEKKKFTEAEMARIKASREVLKIIGEMKEEGAFDEFLKEEHSKI
jgi:hypothetical protein